MRHMRALRTLIGAVITILVTACGGGGGGTLPPPQAVTYAATSGVAQKGPLIKGSTVVAQELDTNLSPTGKQYSYQITSDLGTFSPTSTFGSQYIGLNATGYYFDEIAGGTSSGPVTLNGYSDLTTGSVLNVNLLTTLAYQRIERLVINSNLTFAAAMTQAENEVLAAFNIPAASAGSFSALDLAGGTDGDHILAAISSMFVYGNSAGSLSSLIASVEGDVGTNGTITIPANKSALLAATKGLNPAVVAANLTREYSSLGVTFTTANIADWIDQDGDGVIGRFKFQVPDATPSSSFSLPEFVVKRMAGTNVSTTAGELQVNGTVATGVTVVHAGDVVSVSPGAGVFPNGVLNIYLMSDAAKAARVTFVSGLTSITVTPDSPGIPKGLTQQLTATGTFSDTSTADLTARVSWTSDNPSIATVTTRSGLVQSLLQGSAVITATSGSVAGSTTLSVTPAVLESISITPNPVLSGVGIVRKLTATGTYSDGTTVNVTNVANWTSNSSSVATVGPTTGFVTGVSLGSTAISAMIGSTTDTALLAIVANTWNSPAELGTRRVSHTATLLPNGNVLVAGGISDAATTATAELYDPVANRWSPAHSMAAPRAGHTATLLTDGKVLVVGGSDPYSNFPPTPNAELYDSLTDTWSAAASPSVIRDSLTATLLPNGKVLVAGGYLSAAAELYDPNSNVWISAGILSLACVGHTETLLATGQVLKASGSCQGGQTDTTTAELYDPVPNSWSLTGSLSTGRDLHTATLLANGRVLVAAGEVGTGETASAELYDPLAHTWSLAASLSTARYGHTATLLPDGKVLVAGGFSPFGVTASAELYDPVANNWSATGSMSMTRQFHTATLLPNGVVLVVSDTTSELYW
jgi:uncharacterized protein YjdB